jgi:deoxyribodipyrimidine photolyase
MDHQTRHLVLWWARRDLRTADNDALLAAVEASHAAASGPGRVALLAAYCLDPQLLGPRRDPPEGLGVPQLGPHRCR